MDFATVIKKHSIEQEINEHNSTHTANGALSNSLIDPSLQKEGLIGLFYKSVRGITNETLELYVKKACDEDINKAIALVFYIRDCREGKGERDIARKCFNIIAKEYHEKLLKVIYLLPEYGRWDDLILLSEIKDFEKCVFDIVYNTLNKDLLLMSEKKPVSLCAKWCPTESHKIDKSSKFIGKFTKYHKISRKYYRQHYLTPLRKYINIVESHLCKKDFETIDYSKVPSCAMNKLSKIFEKNDNVRFIEWKTGLKTGDTKVNAKLFPHEIVKKYMNNNDYFCDITNVDELCEAQWKEIVKNANELQNLEHSIVVCDVSGSMFGGNKVLPIHVSVALSLLIAEITKPPFQDIVITFSGDPEYYQIKSKLLYEKINEIMKINWGASTNIQKVFDLILDTGKLNQIPNENMPKKIIIISDMQFNYASENTTNFEEIKNKFYKNEYTMPQLVFWNVNGVFTDCPVTIDEQGTVLMSGYSDIILKYLTDGIECTPWSILLNTLESSRYSKIVDILESIVEASEETIEIKKSATI